MTVIVVEATVNVPVRATPVFGATVNASDPLPVPLDPEPNAIHDSLDVAFQEQSLSVETLIELLPPVKAKDVAPRSSV